MKITVITAVLGVEQDGLDLTYLSLRSLLSRNFIWVIKMDGSNISRSLKKILENQYVYLINESDSGLYNALNQALGVVRGDYFFVLGSGDRVRASALRRLIKQQKVPKPQIIFAGIYHELRRTVWLPDPEAIVNSMSCPHPSTLFSVSLIQKLKGFDERYQVAADYDLILRAIKLNVSTKRVEDIIVDFKGGGMSERTLEGPLECELIRWRIWGKPISWGPRKM